jgi:hypothetical protein
MFMRMCERTEATYQYSDALKDPDAAETDKLNNNNNNNNNNRRCNP